MDIAVLATSSQGLLTAAELAAEGHHVCCVSLPWQTASGRVISPRLPVVPANSPLAGGALTFTANPAMLGRCSRVLITADVVSATQKEIAGQLARWLAPYLFCDVRVIFEEALSEALIAEFRSNLLDILIFRDIFIAIEVATLAQDQLVDTAMPPAMATVMPQMRFAS